MVRVAKSMQALALCALLGAPAAVLGQQGGAADPQKKPADQSGKADPSKPADAPKPADASKPAGSQAASTDVRSLLMKLHQGNEEEVLLGKLAMAKAQSDAVAEFGKMMVNDHTKADLELLDLNRQEKLDFVPESGSNPMPGVGAAGADKGEKSASHEQVVQKLRQASAAQFDREYANAMVAKHEQTLLSLKVAQQQVSDPDVKSFLEGAASRVEDHQKKAQELVQTLAKESASQPGAAPAPSSTAPAGGSKPAPGTPPKQ